MRPRRTAPSSASAADRAGCPAELRVLLDTFADHYNHRRPHRSLPHHGTPAAAYQARPTATPSTDRTGEVYHRVRTDKVDDTGVVTLSANGRLHHIGIGRTHARTHLLLLIHDLQIRVVDAATGELLRELTLDPSRDYQPTGRPQDQPQTTPNDKRSNPRVVGSSVAYVLRPHEALPAGSESATNGLEGALMPS